MSEAHSTTVKKPVPIKLDFKDIRKIRQKTNYKLAEDAIISNTDEHINTKELERILDQLQLTKDEFVKKCIEDEDYRKLASIPISKKASRQGTKDEKLQIDTCNYTAEKCGLIVSNLSTNESRPTKDGSIISKTEMQKKKYKGIVA